MDSLKAVFALFEQDRLVRLTTSNKRLALMEVLVPTHQLEELLNIVSLFRKSAVGPVFSPL